MKEAWYKLDLLQKKHQKTVLLIFCGCVLTSNILLCTKMFFHQDKIILVPPSFSRDITVQGSDISPAYITQMGLYVAHLLLDVSSHHMAFQHDTLMKYIAPKSANIIQAKLKEDAAFYKTQELSTMFHPTHINNDLDQKILTLEGIFTQIEASKIISTHILPLTFLKRV